MKTCVIFNPAARGEKARSFRGFLEKIAGNAAFKPTWAAGAATELARNAVEEGFENIVAAGGDGTLNEVLNGIAETRDGLAKTRLGVLPLGTVNVFAKELRIPEDPQQAWETILAGAERTIDLPFADWTEDGAPKRRYFAQLAGAGLDAEAIALVDWESKRRFRQLAYVFAGLRALLRPAAQDHRDEQRLQPDRGADPDRKRPILRGEAPNFPRGESDRREDRRLRLPQGQPAHCGALRVLALHGAFSKAGTRALSSVGNRGADQSDRGAVRTRRRPRRQTARASGRSGQSPAHDRPLPQS